MLRKDEKETRCLIAHGPQGREVRRVSIDFDAPKRQRGAPINPKGVLAPAVGELDNGFHGRSISFARHAPVILISSWAI